MAEPEFQPSRRTVEELLAGTDYFLIPRFQRPYSWDNGNLEEFWRDSVEDNETGYFIGPMVAWRKNSQSSDLYIVDGQQRLMTIILLIAALRNAFRDFGQASLADGAHQFIEKRDRDNELRFVLQPEISSSYVNNGILSETPDQSVPVDSEEDRTLATVFSEISDRVAREVDGLTNAAARKSLRKIRDKILGLRVIWIEHGNEDDAYVVFETLNSRGKDLEVVDLLKSHLLNLLRRGANRTADAYRDQWMRVRLIIEESQVSIDVNRFVQHWWLSQEDYVAQRKLYQAIRQKVRTKAQAELRLDQLEKDAPQYRAIYEPGSLEWGTEEKGIPSSLDALNVFGVIQPAPVLLAIMRSRRDREVNLKHILSTLGTIERFHFQFTAIAQLSSSGGISEMYARYARMLTSATTRPDRVRSLKLLREALEQRVPDEDVFRTSFVAKLILTDELTREKKLVQYVLRRLLEYTNPHTKTDGGTVEHIASQDQIPLLGADVVGSIGNLLWIPDRLNSQLGNKPFPEKKRILSRVAAQYDLADVLSAQTWGETEIAARADRLSEVAWAEVWKITA